MKNEERKSVEKIGKEAIQYIEWRGKGGGTDFVELSQLTGKLSILTQLVRELTQLMMKLTQIATKLTQITTERPNS